ncbi:molybdopterin biosynthesis protein [Desulfurivibrio dismutans]|uniref:molybdopterin biosynthesis protein n=1 Tax=Desulfurivibrio dismutans TaxID=1398908 RepID=UPI0023D9F746|nr:molybdopterin biosynthesis protein [Desulfurivibrio alkaliphilus]MDF1613524.1 molybdopterin biosynthesis protein [Desulfurivibrio alkaliphilus]
MRRNIYVDNLPLEEAQQRWQSALREHDCIQPREELIPVDQALGRITARAVYAPNSAPFYNSAAMDGIALDFRDTIGASEARPRRLETGRFTPVNTGNALPEGCNAVIMIEDLQPLADGAVEIIAPAPPWQHVRTIGEDIVISELLLPENHVVRPIDLGALLATGVAEIIVKVPPAVAVIPTGSEIVQPGEALRPGNIIEFNSRILAGYLSQWGAQAHRQEIVRDDPELLRRKLEDVTANPAFDLVVINAGASAGSRDFTAQVLEQLGTVVVHGVNIKPGKPVILAIVNHKPVIGLPGYPVSAVLTLRLFGKALVDQWLGRGPEENPTIPALMSRPLPSKLGTIDFVRVKLGQVGDKLIATPTGHGAGAVMTLVQADGILTVPAASEGIAAGAEVQIDLLRSLKEIANTLVFIGSHDNILDVITNLLHRRRPLIRLSSSHVGSMGGIMAIKRGEAHLAGSHLLDEASGEYNVPYIKKILGDVPLKLINLAWRQQGLLVPKGNPKGITGFADLKRDDISFINRQRGAGTRILTDLHLNKLGIAPEEVTGYHREEYTHMTVASAVAGGNADTGLAIMAAARALDLDFIPVAKERYDLIIPTAHAADPKVAAVLELINTSREFHDTVTGLGGYDLSDCGKLMYEQ